MVNDKDRLFKKKYFFWKEEDEKPVLETPVIKANRLEDDAKKSYKRRR